jgi:hypothetical protein
MTTRSRKVGGKIKGEEESGVKVAKFFKVLTRMKILCG